MALTRDFKESVQARARRDPAFGQALLQEALTTMLEGDLETGKAVLRDYINAIIGFEALGRATGTPPKSLMRMFGPRGNPQASNLFAVLGYLQEQGGFHLEVRADPPSKPSHGRMRLRSDVQRILREGADRGDWPMSAEVHRAVTPGARRDGMP